MLYRIGFLIHGVHIALRVSTASDSFILLLYSTLQCSDESIVLTSQPLQDDELFEVRLDSIAGRWSGSLVFGATTVNAENFQFPRLITSCSTGTTFLLSSNKMLINDKEMATIPKDLTSLSDCITRLVHGNWLPWTTSRMPPFPFINPGFISGSLRQGILSLVSTWLISCVLDNPQRCI